MLSAPPLPLINKLEKNDRSIRFAEFTNLVPDLHDKLFESGFRFHRTASYRIEKKEDGNIILLEDWEHGLGNTIAKVKLNKNEVSALNDAYETHLKSAPKIQVIPPRITTQEVKALVGPSVVGMLLRSSSSNFLATVNASSIETANLLEKVKKWVNKKYPAMVETVQLHNGNFRFTIAQGDHARENKYNLIKEFQKLNLDGINKFEGQGRLFEVPVSSFQKILPLISEAKPAKLPKSQSAQIFNFQLPPESPSRKSNNLEPASFTQATESPSKKSKTPGSPDEPSPSPKKSRSPAGTPTGH